MPELTLYIGNRNYSSWSLRGHLAVAHVGVPFDEVLIPLHRPDSPPAIRKHSPSSRVPALVHRDLTVWDSLAIGEYLAETFPEAKLWPDDRAARAVARSVSAEMHSSFAALRQHMPMNLRGRFPGRGRTIGALEPHAYAAKWHVATLPFDYVVFTPRASDEDACANMRRK